MRRSLTRLATALLLVAGGLGVEPVAASSPQGAITWTVDHDAKTVTVIVRLQIYPGCSGDPYGDNPTPCATGASASIANQFLADKIKKQIEDVWNGNGDPPKPPTPYQYRCYKLFFNVDIKVASDSSHIDDDRVAVRIDPSPAGIRDYVSPEANDPARWQSNDPADRHVPTNDADHPTTWGEASQWETTVYAHEFGHVIGLSDAYRDVVDPDTGKVVGSEPQPGAPLDLMSTLGKEISKETIDRLVERNGQVLVDRAGQSVDLEDLKCDRYGFVGTWPLPSGNHFPVPIGAVSCTPDLAGAWAVIYYVIDPAIEVDALIAAMNDSANRVFTGLWQAGKKGLMVLEIRYEGVLTPFEGPPPTVTLDVTVPSAPGVRTTQDFELSPVESAPDICPPT